MSRFLDTLAGRAVDRPPFWFMRQAGRYLPEYRAVRAEAGDFLSLCYDPVRASEVTLQPIRRYGMDAAIIFSDILVIPHGLGQKVWFETGEGPRLEPLGDPAAVEALDLEALVPFLAPVYEAIARTRAALAADTALIGFCGAPWTLACYMLEGRGKTGFINARKLLYRAPQLVQALLDRLVDAAIRHLGAQIDAGAQAVQIFDSWAGLAPATHHEMLLIEPVRRIVAGMRQQHPDVPVIAFPRGIGRGIEAYAAAVEPDGLSVDTETDLTAVGAAGVLQGNLDPLLLATDGDGVVARARQLRQAMAGRRLIVNLGHGVVPETPPEHVAMLSDYLRSAG